MTPAALEVLGVDFSGARSDRNTWLTHGRLEGRTLVLESCHPVRRAELTDRLAGTRGPSVAALDFPFSVPRSFARYWQPSATTMPDLWAAAADLDLADFIALRDRFVARHGEPKRLADTYFKECFSCLHKANPNMVPMTFYGMRMLHRLGVAEFQVPPLEAASPAPRAVLLEAMPGAALRALRLPFKGFKTGRRAAELRARVLAGLPRQAPLELPNLSEFREPALNHHDCLDSIVACVTAALWARDQELFRRPAPPGSADFDPVTRLEGWLYAPVWLQPPAPVA